MSFIISGKVVSGNKLGSKLGFPTANIAIADDLPIKNGVYSATIATSYGIFNGMASLGTRPTVTSHQSRWLEVNIFDFDHDLYNKTIEVTLVDFIREQYKFTSVNQLKEQIERDKTQIQNRNDRL